VANMKCPKCGSKVSTDGIGDANSAMCFSCGASILVSTPAPEVLVPLATRRMPERHPARKTPIPIVKPKPPEPIPNLEEPEPFVRPEVSNSLAEPEDSEPVAEPNYIEPLPKLRDREPLDRAASYDSSAKPKASERAAELVDYVSLPKLSDPDLFDRPEMHESSTNPRYFTPPPIPPPRPSTRQIRNAAEYGPPLDNLAMASLALGIGSFLCAGPLFSIPGIAVGVAALNRALRTRRPARDVSLARGGIAINGISLFFSVLFLMTK